MDADGARSLGIGAAAARPEVDAGRGRRETFVDGRLLEYLDSAALALSARWRPLPSPLGIKVTSPLGAPGKCCPAYV